MAQGKSSGWNDSADKTGNDIFPIPGTTKPYRLDENVASVGISLSSSEEKELRKLCEEAEVSIVNIMQAKLIW